MSSVHTVGVVGAGVMGRGVTIALRQAGFPVILIDRDSEILDGVRRAIAHDVRLYALLAPESAITAAEVADGTVFSTDLADLNGVDLVVENVTERFAVKEPVYRRLGELLAPGTPIGVNTSAIPITRLGGLTGRPEDVVGTHFMNPVPLKPTVEVIRGRRTSEETLARMREFIAALGKKSVVVNDSPGFVTNRVMMLTVNEAVFLLHEGVGTAADIDRLFVECFGHTMGPLETADLIGLDTVLLSIEVLHDEFKDSKYRPCPLLTSMVDAGLHGRKSGQGFFDYGSGASGPGRAG
ncbi:3-hydroxyacyl-CoA dehydrogenase (EC 1.1.1.35) [Actinokineospora globicatena]|uniref:3-hydroxyacyl-CoA dehydrogenase family protein n=1 Tax=Actinokineospora globicatena TaxID=103729 RepID=UPI0024A3B54E|nr:3-hydroxyacyl-CoA dehydrogenase family protein [Actinokineospora globicatena]MCP2302371.1 3-hydroxyacyl-CoA dehydrogenase (EC 1.1.1.35) [Actinokineospora globicatena]GLW75955.1 3-hydroxybutyryl-CoA dehydrogenase [Actinokineospora globicatena]GLW82795.1 3-hydroxybutyryl-CoA dehydrogenase [Actinokineospora globicatena]